MILERIEDGLVWRKLTRIKSHRSLACSACVFFFLGGGGQAKAACLCLYCCSHYLRVGARAKEGDEGGETKM